MSTTATCFERKSIVLERIKPDCDWKQWHNDNFEKIKKNKFENLEWVQPSCDHRTYKYLLLNNGIKVLLIYDNKQERKCFEQNRFIDDEQKCNDNNDIEMDSSSNIETDGNNYYNVALCVNRGYYQDFDDTPGIAHYCEHMLFMGNKKYPKENDWEDWLSSNGGSANASTHNLFTNYVFDIAPKGKQLLFEALDRFAHNFISPLFNPDASERELNSIQQEFTFHKTDDSYKQWLILKRHVLKRKDIPYYKFGSGNKQTLNKHDINDKLIKYWTQNYLPSNMSLVILSDILLDELEKYVVTLFEQITIPNNYKSMENEKKDNEIDIDDINHCNNNDKKNVNNALRMEPNLLQPIYGKLFRVNAVKELYTLDVYWTLNGKECSKYYDSSPTCMISELLGHEGKGSLYQILNDQNYINSLECGYESGPEGLNHQFELFEINLDLTEKGYDQVYKIVDYIFGYLAMLNHQLLRIVNDNIDDNKNKNVDDIVDINEYFMEAKSLGEIAFNFSNRTDGWDLVDDLSIKMHLYPIQHLLSADYLFWKYDPVLILDALKELTPNRCCLMLLSMDAIDYKHKIKDENIPSINDRILDIEPILETKYTMEDIPKCYMNQWTKYMNGHNNYDNSNNKFHLPIRNTFIPKNLNLLSDDIFIENKLFKHFLDIEKEEHCGPELLVYNENMKLYYKLDRTYFVPKSYITMVFEHHLIATQDGLNLTALEILIDMFDQYSSTDVYLATLSGLDFSFDRLWRGLKFKVCGYSEKLIPFLKKLLNQFKTFKLNKQLFETQKNAYIRRIKNAIIDCEDHLPYIARKCITFKPLTIETELNAANNLTLNDIENIRNLLFVEHKNDLRIYGLFMGNLHPNIVNDCSNYIINTFNINNKNNDNDNHKIAMYDKYLKLQNENKFLSQNDQRKIRLLFSKCNFQTINIPKGRRINICKEICISEDEDNEGTLILFQIDDKPVDNNNDKGIGILCAFLKTLLFEPFYDALRTKQQLGYEVSISYETVNNLPFLKFEIISSEYNPNYLTLQILKWINISYYNEYILNILQENDYEKFKDTIDSSIRSRKIECLGLSSRHNSYWNEIFTYNTLEFDAKLSEIKSLKSFTFQHIKKIYDQKLMLKNGNTQCLVIQVWKQQQQDHEEMKSTETTTETNSDIDDNDEQEIININSLNDLKQRLNNDLNLDVSFNEITDIVTWQNTLNLSPSFC